MLSYGRVTHTQRAPSPAQATRIKHRWHPGALVARVAVAATLFAAGLPAQATMTGTPRTGTDVIRARGDSTQMLVSLLTVANRDAITAAQLASTRAARADVKAFAATLATEHRTALQQIYDSAAVGGWVRRDTLPDSAADGMWGLGAQFSINAKQPDSLAQKILLAEVQDLRSGDRAAMEKLENANGPSFDQLFLSTQIDRHEALLKALAAYRISNTKLNEIVASTKLAAEQHMARARQLQGIVGRPH